MDGPLGKARLINPIAPPPPLPAPTHTPPKVFTLRTVIVSSGVLLGILLVFAGFASIFYFHFSGHRFAFRDAHASLNNHLRKDFGCELAPSAIIANGYWVATNDPEEVYEIHLAPADTETFIGVLRVAATAKGYKIEDFTTDPLIDGSTGLPRVEKPTSGKPLWWNDPPIARPIQIRIPITDRSGVTLYSYLLVASPSDGRIYLAWTGF